MKRLKIKGTVDNFPSLSSAPATVANSGSKVIESNRTKRFLLKEG